MYRNTRPSNKSISPLRKPEYTEKAKAKERFTKTNDIRIDQEVQHAFKNFHKLRWINLKEDDFTNLPEFQRITRKFADYINHIDEWLKEE